MVVVLVLVHLTYMVVEEVLEVSFIPQAIHLHQQINPLASPTQWVLAEKESESQIMVKDMMVVETKVAILHLQSLEEL